MNLSIYQVDAFTGSLFAGNPAAIVFCRSFLPAPLTQSIAAGSCYAGIVARASRSAGGPSPTWWVKSSCDAFMEIGCDPGMLVKSTVLILDGRRMVGISGIARDRDEFNVAM